MTSDGRIWYTLNILNYMKKSKPTIIKKIHKNPCYVCSKVGDIPTPRKKCKCCKGTGVYKETSYVIIVGGIAFDMDNIS